MTTLTPSKELQAAFMTPQENRELQKALKIEYAKLDYVCFVNELLFRMNNSNASIAMTMCNDFLFILNKVLLDNIFRYVATKDTHKFMTLLAHGTFSKDMYVSPFYVNQIIEASGIYLEDKTELENEIVRRLQVYIDDIYTKHVETLNIQLLAMFESMWRNFQHLNIAYFKFELMNYVQPILLYTEYENENYLYSWGTSQATIWQSEHTRRHPCGS